MKILLVAKHTLFRDGIKLLLKKSDFLNECDEASDLTHALKLVESQLFDIVLLDINLQQATGLDTLRKLNTATKLTPILAIADEFDVRAGNQAISFGASGIVSKASPYNELLKAIQLVSTGKTYRSQALPSAVLSDAANQREVSPTSVLWSLSDRQREVLKHIARGSSNKGISAELNISPNTVKAHLASIFKILGVQNRTEAFYFAARAGMPLD